MTIAGLYLSPEGVVLGADSTSSVNGANGYHYFNFGQKLFEIGEGSTFGILTWGMGALGQVSYRALIAILADQLKAQPPASVREVADRWIGIFWPAFSALPDVQRWGVLNSKPVHDPNDANSRTEDEEREHDDLGAALAVGFCIAGYVTANREPDAYEMFFEVGQPQPTPQQVRRHHVSWWGIQNVMNRVIYGADDVAVGAVMQSGMWNGTRMQLVQALTSNPWLPRAQLPIRDAIDYVHSAIYCTVKAMKFSNLPQVCGGPIEIAVITADRRFRWVRHKDWDAAIAEGDNR